MKKKILFSILFLTILLADIIFNNIEGFYLYRAITKPLISISLMAFYYFNSKCKPKKERSITLFALFFLLIGDIFLLEEFDFSYFLIGFVAFMLANIAYSYLLYRSANFGINKSIPFLIGATIYLLVIYYLIYDNLQGYFIPVLFYVFVVLNMTQSAYLRYKIVNNRSFYLVLTGCILFVISESIVALNVFHKPVPFKNITIMLFYGLGQLLIIHGILAEQKKFRRF